MQRPALSLQSRLASIQYLQLSIAGSPFYFDYPEDPHWKLSHFPYKGINSQSNRFPWKSISMEIDYYEIFFKYMVKSFQVKFLPWVTIYIFHGMPIHGRDSMKFSKMDLHQLAGGDYVKSIEYSSELLRKISKIWEVLAWRN